LLRVEVLVSPAVGPSFGWGGRRCVSSGFV
jgi:hypothetical protein